MGFIISNSNGSELYDLGYCSMEEMDEPEIFEKNYPAIDRLYKEVKIIFDHPRSVILPFNETVGEDPLQLLNMVYGFAGRSIALTENISSWQLKNTYAVPAELFDWLGRKFPVAKYLHQYSVSIMNMKDAGDEGKLQVDLSNNKFTAVAGRQNKFLLAQSFEYETPNDVLFYLLKLCERCSLSPKNVSLELSGLIDKDSSLYKELYQYFINISFREANWGTAGDHPAHFFTSFNDIIQCAS